MADSPPKTLTPIEAVALALGDLDGYPAADLPPGYLITAERIEKNLVKRGFEVREKEPAQ